MENTTPGPSLRINTFYYMIKVWLTTFGIGTAGYMACMGPELFVANFWAFCASIPALVPVYFIAYNGGLKVGSVSYKKAYMCMALILAYFLTCVVLACFFETVTMFQMALLFGFPHFIVGLIVIWAFKLPENI